ncbi:hypothetical protein JCM11251_005012 [Rhodosporidiobolus azoricus]
MFPVDYHPLSPPLETASSAQPLFPDTRSPFRSPRVHSDEPLFPASPPAVEETAASDLGRRDSTATLLGVTSPSDPTGLGLGFPRAVAPDEPLPRRASRSRPRSLHSPATSSTSPETPIPPLLVLPSAPHLLETTSLATLLPGNHLAALAQCLSQDLSAAQALLEDRVAELAALERLAEEKGAGKGEIERAKVRARAELKERSGVKESSSEGEEALSGKGTKKGKGKLQKRRRSGKEKETAGEEWKIETGEFASAIEAEDEEIAEDEKGEEVPLKTEVDLDLEDLTEAISSNAFDLGLQPTSPSSLHFPKRYTATAAEEDAPSIRSRALSLPFPTTSATPTPDDQSDTASMASSTAGARPVNPGPSSSAPAMPASMGIKHGGRGRHASLSARIFGFGGTSSPSGSTDQPPSGTAPSLVRSGSSSSLGPSASTPPPPPSLGVNPASPQKVPLARTRKARSASIQSNRSVRSVTSITSGQGYSDWLWKAAGGWGGKARAGSILEGNEGAGAEAAPSQEDEAAKEDGPAADDNPVETDIGEPALDESSSSSRRPSTTTTANTGITEATTSWETSPLTPDRPSSSRSHSSPSSPTLSRRRSSAPPPRAMLSASVTLPTNAGVEISKEVTEGTMSAPGGASSAGDGRSPSSRSSSLPPPPPLEGVQSCNREEGATREEEVEGGMGEEEGEDKLGGTIKARSAPAASQPSPKEHVGRPKFVPGVPLFSASPFADSPSGDAVSRLTSLQKSATDDGYVAAARGTLTRALGLGTNLPASLSSRSLSLAANASSASSSSIGPDTPSEPNLTLFPRLPALSLSRYALFAQPTLSTPATHVSLAPSSASVPSVAATGTGSPLVAHTAVLASGTNGVSAGTGTANGVAKGTSGAGGASLTMELSTISGEAAPPSLALLKPSYSAASSAVAAAGINGEEEGQGEDDDGPMIDRYGFIYDVRQGMELLKARRGRQQEKRGKGKKAAVKAKAEPQVEKILVSPALVAVGTPIEEQAPVLLTPPTELEVHPQLEALREAIGLTPTTEEGKTLSAPPASPPPVPDEASSSSSPDPPATNKPAKLVRAPASPPPSRSAFLSHLSSSPTSSPAPSLRSSDTAPSTTSTGPQSMRALLAQMRTMTDADEKAQRDAWDVFIRRRQVKLAKLKKKEREAALSLADGERRAKEKKEKKRARATRPETMLFSPTAADDNNVDMAEEDVEEVWTSENLVGVAQMGTEKKGKEDWTEFKELVRKGIPIAYRPKIWGECSSANEAREPGVYQELLAHSPTEAEAPCLKQIDMDCHRTFPTNVFFAGDGPGVTKLRNVLVAYSRRNPKIGYCQGMNNLVATLLLTHPAEEDAFWVLVCIIENILPSDYYTSHLLVSRADQEVLRDLVARVLPDTAAHLEEHGVELSAITFGWFLSLFTDVLPIQTLLRVWDLFFVHGTILLFRIALAILKLHEADLLACDSAASLYGLLGTLPTHLYHADKLLKVACEDLASSVKDREVSVLRNQHVAELQEQMGLSHTEEAS